MLAVDIIRAKRDGVALNADQIQEFVRGATTGHWPDYQLSAMLMAIVIRGMTPDETVALTGAMTRSGMTLDLSDIPGPKADKHSTGGVGDSTSLVLVPLAAACGVIVPMMSGRGLGHTGGTLDKLESIPGFRVGLSLPEMKTVLRAVGAVMIGQTSEVAPADKKLYALRDVTATVESIPLIAASILSKKLAEGLDALVLDVKFGNGAFMKTRDDAQTLAETMAGIGNAHGVRTEAVLTPMDFPLGVAIGNAFETIECLETLKGRGPKDLESLSIDLAARMIRLAGLEPTQAGAETRAREALTSGRGLEIFRRMIELQGGDPKVIDDYKRFATAPHHVPVTAPRSGRVMALRAEPLGRAAMVLGAGRARAEDAVDPGAGILLRAVAGETIKAGQTVLELHYRDAQNLDTAVALAQGAIEIA
jgi:pyrimidine-nucleoside phosphorylase